MAEELVPVAEQSLEERQSQRMEHLPEIYRTKHERMCCELALDMENADVIFASYGYNEEQAVELVESPAFIAMLERITREVRESGLSFRMKARAQAEELLATSFEMATDPYISASVRADLIKWTGKMAGHEPKEKDESKLGIGGLTLSITFAGQAPEKIVQGEPLVITQEHE